MFMKKINIYKESGFSDKAFRKLLVHDYPYFKILNFNFKEGQDLPVHSHEIEGNVSIAILEVGESFWVKMRSPYLLNQVMS